MEMKFWNLFTMATSLAEDAATGTADAATAEMSTGATVLSTVISFLPMVLIIVVFYFLLIRPQRKKDKKVKEMLAALKVGDRVTTIGGIHGTIMGIKDDTITLGVGAEKTKLVFARWAIRNVDEVSIANDGETLV
ncbi:MAG: preprotein translocase subunit YajC [Christensenellales bacterium]|nr:preprotein translocase subunit YajC [Christensenellales bacterium]